MLRRLIRALKGEQTDNTTGRTSESPDTTSFDHFTDAVDTIKQLKREQRHNEAEELLRWCITQAEADNEFADPPPWYYKHLAIIYRKDDRYEDEVRILERYLSEAATPREDLEIRLQRAKELAENAG
ncbi:hypothetical protein [Halomontanus rarus]|uniref:hypothetical protein n=1 Tax=Halomontanus rarus TaxID=3034020 RepID=UPI00293BE5EE|nr:hypothetical protein [Halovivax sp. KZCA124]